MITSFLLYVVYVPFAFFVGLLPVIAFPAAFSGAITTIWGLVNALSFLLPVGVILTCLGLAMTFHVSILLWRLFHLIGGYIRGR